MHRISGSTKLPALRYPLGAFRKQTTRVPGPVYPGTRGYGTRPTVWPGIGVPTWAVTDFLAGYPGPGYPVPVTRVPGYPKP
eukprot:1640560-Rhodomonas_salina.1